MEVELIYLFIYYHHYYFKINPNLNVVAVADDCDIYECDISDTLPW